MDTRTFLETLEAHPDKSLVFDLGDRQVDPGYHVTEIKTLSVRSMDCGGQADRWTETVLQLWAPRPKPEDGPMRVRKFLDIYQRVSAHLPLDDDALMRVEFGDVGAPSIAYLVDGVVDAPTSMTVQLQAPGVACKAQGQRTDVVPSASGGSGASTCCG